MLLGEEVWVIAVFQVASRSCDALHDADGTMV
jgi:hypothetical protein